MSSAADRNLVMFNAAEGQVHNADRHDARVQALGRSLFNEIFVVLADLILQFSNNCVHYVHEYHNEQRTNQAIKTSRSVLSSSPIPSPPAFHTSFAP